MDVEDTLFADRSASEELVNQIEVEQDGAPGENNTTAVNKTGECAVIERRTVFVANGERDCSSELGSVVELSQDHSSEPRFLVKNSSRWATNEDGALYGRMLPHLFPFGRGHPGKSRRVPVSQECD